MGYRHTQVGTLVLVALVPVTVLGLYVASVVRFHAVAVAVFAVLLLCVVTFSALTVQVTDRHVQLRFGPGPIGKRFALSEIRQARAVRNPWYYGWGIRWFPRGWLFNVSGLDAVEIEMANGSRYRIGTDEPRELLAAIDRARGRW